MRVRQNIKSSYLAIWPKEEYCTVHNIYKSVAFEAMSNSLFLPTNADESFMWWLSRVSDKPMFIVTSGTTSAIPSGGEPNGDSSTPGRFDLCTADKQNKFRRIRQPDRHWLHELDLGCCSGKVRETVLEENGKTKTKDLQTGDGYNRPATATTPTFN